MFGEKYLAMLTLVKCGRLSQLICLLGAACDDDDDDGEEDDNEYFTAAFFYDLFMRVTPCYDSSGSLSSPHDSLFGIPQGSVLGPLLFILHTTPLSTLISSRSLNHHFCAVDTHIFLSFRPPDFQSSLPHLQDVLQHISSWMTANILTLNSSKTEFLLIRLKQQLAKIHNSSLNTTHSARNLGFIFDEHLTFSDQISTLSKSCYSHIRQLCCVKFHIGCQLSTANRALYRIT